MTSELKSGRPCQICGDPRVDQIEADLMKPGKNMRAVARRWDLGRMSVGRHVKLHLPTRMRRAAEATKKAPAAEKTLQQLSELNQLARAVFTRGYNENNLPAALGALGELRKIVEFESRVLGVVRDPGARLNIDVTVDRDALTRMAGAFLDLQRREAAALPEARVAIETEIVDHVADVDDRVMR